MASNRKKVLLPHTMGKEGMDLLKRRDDIEVESEPFSLEDLYAPGDPDARRVLSLVNSWMELVTALNELARSMGHQDFYPFVMSRAVLRKLHFIQLVVKNERQTVAAS